MLAIWHYADTLLPDTSMLMSAAPADAVFIVTRTPFIFAAAMMPLLRR